MLAALAKGRHTYVPGRQDDRARTVCALCGGVWEDPRHNRGPGKRRTSSPRVIP
jgi:hypothetical protein